MEIIMETTQTDTRHTHLLNSMEKDQRIYLHLRNEGIQPGTFEDSCSLLVYCNQNGLKLPIKRKVNFQPDEAFTFEPALQKDKRGKPGIKSLFPHLVPKEALRLFMTGIYFDDGNMVATDAHTLVIVKAGDAKQYAAELETAYFKRLGHNTPTVDVEQWSNPQGKIMDMNGFLVEYKYPDYKSIIPKDNPHQVTKSAEELCSLFLTHKVALQNAQTHDILPHVVLKVKELSAWFNPDLLHRTVKTLWDNGAKEITISYSNAKRAFVFTSDDGNMGICMPLLNNGEDLGIYTTIDL